MFDYLTIPCQRELKGDIKNSFLPACAQGNSELKFFLGNPKKHANLRRCVLTEIQ